MQINRDFQASTSQQINTSQQTNVVATPPNLGPQARSFANSVNLQQLSSIPNSSRTNAANAAGGGNGVRARRGAVESPNLPSLRDIPNRITTYLDYAELDMIDSSYVGLEQEMKFAVQATVVDAHDELVDSYVTFNKKCYDLYIQFAKFCAAQQIPFTKSNILGGSFNKEKAYETELLRNNDIAQAVINHLNNCKNTNDTKIDQALADIGFSLDIHIDHPGFPVEKLFSIKSNDSNSSEYIVIVLKRKKFDLISFENQFLKYDDSTIDKKAKISEILSDPAVKNYTSKIKNSQNIPATFVYAWKNK